MKNVVTMSIRLPVSLMDPAKRMAEEQLISVSAVVRQALLSHLGGNTKQHKSACSFPNT